MIELLLYRSAWSHNFSIIFTQHRSWCWDICQEQGSNLILLMLEFFEIFYKRASFSNSLSIHWGIIADFDWARTKIPRIEEARSLLWYRLLDCGLTSLRIVMTLCVSRLALLLQISLSYTRFSLKERFVRKECHVIPRKASLIQCTLPWISVTRSNSTINHLVCILKSKSSAHLWEVCCSMSQLHQFWSTADWPLYHELQFQNQQNLSVCKWHQSHPW